MPATPVTPTFSPLTNPRVLWANLAAANNFFESFSFNITGVNLPTPTTTALGGVMWLELLPLTLPAVDLNYAVLASGDGVTTQEVPTKEAFLSLKAQYDALKSYVEVLAAQLILKGYVSS